MILGLGTILVDQQMLLAQFPEVDTKNEVCGQRLQVGGPVPTALVLLSRWGHRCGLIGKWADDLWGRYIASDLHDEGISVTHCHVATRGQTGQAHVWIDQSNGQRTVAFSRGTCGDITESDVQAIDFSQCRLLHLDGWSAAAAKVAAERVKRAGGLVTMDSGSPKPGMEHVFPYLDLINCPSRFAEQFFDDRDCAAAAARLRRLGARQVVFTDGDQGAVLYHDQGVCRQPAFCVKPVVDTNGAGDVFTGSLIHGLLKGWSAEPMLRYAAATAALKCQKLGNRDALPTPTDVGRLLAECPAVAE